MSEELIISDINGICRLCLKDNGTIIPIFGRENTSRDCIPLSKKILDCVSVNVFDGDGLPNTICVSCVHQVDSWHGFKNTCDSSQQKLSSWLKKTNPELFEKNKAQKRLQNRRNLIETSGQPFSVIDVSSDDDDVIVTQPLVIYGPSDIRQRVRNRHSRQSQNIDLLSINTNEIEILPIEDVERFNEKESDSTIEITQAQPSQSVLSDGLAASITLVSSRSDNDHILPDSGMPEGLNGPNPELTQVQSSTKDMSSKEHLYNGQNCEGLSEDNSNEFEANGNKKEQDLGQVQVDVSEFDLVSANEASESQEHDALAEGTSELPFANTQNPLVPAEQENTDWSKLNGAEDISGKENGQETVENRIAAENTNGAHVSINVENSITLDKNLELSEELPMNSTDNNSSFVIEKITSLTNHERLEEDVNSQEQDNDRISSDGQSCSRISQDDNSEDAQPDIVLCDPSMVNMLSIKEEPLSASEATGDEEDPLNFHSVTLKRESEDWVNETEDVKPNIRLLNEAMVNMYSPKRLKCGKLHCEPCRVSFINDVYYERHATSLRHKLNFKLYRTGRAPTRKRGRSLIQAIMGNNFETVPHIKNGPFFCNKCPSAFKHARNLTTHLKKHLVEEQFSDKDHCSPSGSQDTFALDPSIDESDTPSKPPMRISAQNVKFVNQADTSCDLCDQTFTTLPALLSHKRYCGFSENRVCRLCQQSFTTLSLFFKHRKMCTKLYRQQTLAASQQQVRHIPSAAPSPVPKDGSVLACTLCNLTFETSTGLIDHMQMNHMDFGTPQQSTASELPNFVKPNHFSRTNDSKLHYCKYCSRSFSTHSALSSHTGYHARKSIYCCKFCRHNFRDKITFRQHMKVHIGNPNLNRNVCWICYTPFSTQTDLFDHKSVHTKMKMKIFSCDSCDNSYNTRELLLKHKRTAHNSSQPMTMFGDHFLGDVLETERKVEIIDEDNKLFKCRICKKRFTTIGNLKRHNLIHKRPPNLGSLSVEHAYQNRCNWCFRAFKTQSGLLNHRPLCNRVKTTAVPNVNNFLIGNSLNKSLKCKGCKKWFASKNSLYKHKVLKRCRMPQINTIVQPQLRPQNCPSCDQQFLSEESLDRHKQHCKPTIERLTCDCGEVFPTVDQKFVHAESCPGNCTCKFCNMKFNSPEEMDSHKSICQIQSQSYPSPEPSISNEIQISRMPPLECQKCNKKFIYNKCLQMHQDKCLYDRWPCSNCMEIFATESALATHKSHKQCHSPRLNKPLSVIPVQESPTFKCEYCPIKFISVNELKQHALTCGNKPSVRRNDASSIYRPWVCDMCDKSFLWKANLWRHKKIIHKIVVQSKRSLTAANSSSGSPSRSQDGEKGGYKCDLCPGIIFHKQQGFLEHQLAHDQDESKRDNESNIDDGSRVLLTCELCDKRIPETLYPMHMDEHMNDDFEGTPEQVKENPTGETFACDICGKEFATALSRKSHRATHYRTGDIMAHHMSPKKKDKRKLKVKHVRCSTCHKLLSINSIHKHKMMHAREEAEFYGENPNLTPIKSLVLNTPRSTTPSVMSDVPSNPGLNEEDDTTTVFPCPKCDGSFKLRKSLMEHLKGHTEDSMETESTSSATGPADQYQYKCVYCDLSWKYKSVYERHLGSKKHLEIQKQLSGII